MDPFFLRFPKTSSGRGARSRGRSWREETPQGGYTIVEEEKEEEETLFLFFFLYSSDHDDRGDEGREKPKKPFGLRHHSCSRWPAVQLELATATSQQAPPAAP